MPENLQSVLEEKNGKLKGNKVLTLSKTSLTLITPATFKKFMQGMTRFFVQDPLQVFVIFAFPREEIQIF